MSGYPSRSMVSSGGKTTVRPSCINVMQSIPTINRSRSRATDLKTYIRAVLLGESFWRCDGRNCYATSPNLPMFQITFAANAWPLKYVMTTKTPIVLNPSTHL